MSKNWSNGLESEPVTTYIDSDVKDSWEKHAEKMDLSLSRFIEMMVNAGRKQYSDSASINTNDSVSLEKENKVLRDRLETNKTEKEEPALKIYNELSDKYRDIEEISSATELDENTVYESLQELLSADLAEYSHVKNAYRREK